MIDAQQIADYLNEKLNLIGQSRPKPYRFDIVAEVGAYSGTGGIGGIVRTYSSDLVPVPADIADGVRYVEVKYTYVVDLLVPAAKQYNGNVIRINEIVNVLIESEHDKKIPFSDGEGIVTFKAGRPNDYQIAFGIGECVPVTFTVSVTFTKNAVTSADKHWLLDGTEIPFLQESVSVEKDGIPKKIYTENYGKILLTGQTKFYTFRIPYESSAYKLIQSEILDNGSVNGIVHTLTYYDGSAFTQESPYVAKVVIYRSGSSASSRPNGSEFNVTFSDAYDSAGKTIRYLISLIDFPFDMQGEDTRYFGSVAEQTAYFEQKAAESSAPFVEIMAPNLDNLIITQQVYYNANAGDTSQFDYASKNYAVIKAVAGDKTYYFYYFIEKATIGAGRYILCDLRLDTVQTYFFNPEIAFSDCLIERAHLNRFEQVQGESEEDSAYVRFLSDPTSKIFNAEDGLSFPKRLVKRTKLKLKFTGNDQVDDWLNENVAYWVYIFISPSDQINGENQSATYKVGTLQSPYKGSLTLSSSAIKIKYDEDFYGAAGVLCYPVYKNALEYEKGNHAFLSAITKNVIGLQINPYLSGTEIKVVPCYLGRKSFEEINKQSSYYYSIKLSIIPPFDYVNGFSIDSNNNLILAMSQIADGGEYAVPMSVKNGERIMDHDNFRAIRTYGEDPDGIGYMEGLFSCRYQKKKEILSYDFLTGENEKIPKSLIIAQQSPNMKYNPKLNGQNFKELTITSANGDSFVYDIQKLVEPTVVFKYSEPIVPEITRYYLRVQGGTGLYVDETDENYMGLVGSSDNSLAFTNDQYAAFLANNKNFYMQSNIKIANNLISGFAESIGKIFSGDIVGGAAQSIATPAKSYLSIIDRSLTADNMKNAPDQMKNANGNVIFNMFATELGLYVEEYAALDGDMKTANDFMDLYGFTYGSVGNVRDFVHIRKYHNYVKAQLQAIQGNLSNVARGDLRQRFANGVRFWNQDNISYERENYEIWLEE